MPDALEKLVQSPAAAAEGRQRQRYAAAAAQQERTKTGGDAYAGLSLVVRNPRRFAVGERSAHMDTFFGNYLDWVADPSRAKAKDPDVQNRMRQDLQVIGCIRVRQLATVGLKRQWESNGDDEQSKHVAKTFEKLFDQQWRVSEALLHMLDALLDGISIQELVWGLNEEDYTFGIERMFPSYKDRFVFTKDGKLCLRTRENWYWGEQVHPWQFVQHVYNPGGGAFARPEDEGRLYWGQGLEDHIYPNYYFKTVILNLATRWLQRLASGVFIGRYPYKDAEARAVMQEILDAWQQGEEFAIPSTGGEGDPWGVEIKEGTRAPADTYLSFIEYFDKQIAKLVLGATLVNDQTDVGSHALGEVQMENTFQRIVEFDRMGLEETINRQIIPVIGKLNHIPKRLWPTFSFQLELKDNLGDVLDAYLKLKQLGFAVSAEMVSDDTGFRQPRPGETLLQASMTPDGGFAFGGGGVGGMAGGPKGPLAGLDLTTPQGMAKFRAIVNRSAEHHRGMARYTLSESGVGATHRHAATLDGTGNGETDAGPDGHKHDVRGWAVTPDRKHTHELLVRNTEVERIVQMLASTEGPSPRPFVYGHDRNQKRIPKGQEGGGEFTADDSADKNKTPKSTRTMREHLADIEPSTAKTPLARKARRINDVWDGLKTWFLGLNPTIDAADGSRIVLHNPERGNRSKLENRLNHLITDKGNFHPEKAQWVQRIPETLQTAHARAIDDRTGNRLFMRKYADGVHAVVVQPDGQVVDQKPFGGNLITQFAPGESHRQMEMRVDWSQYGLQD